MARFFMICLCGSIVAVLSVAITAAADDGPVAAAKSAFRPLDKNDDVPRLQREGAAVLGDYVLSAEAVKAFGHSHELKQLLEQVETGNGQRLTEENARLTVRQLLNNYIDDARNFYDGKGQRRAPPRGKRQRERTDEQLGDEQLASALASVCMAGAWSIPLEQGQADALAALVARRITALEEAANRIEVDFFAAASDGE